MGQKKKVSAQQTVYPTVPAQYYVLKIHKKMAALPGFSRLGRAQHLPDTMSPWLGLKGLSRKTMIKIGDGGGGAGPKVFQ